MEISREHSIYLAGLFDGEGCITINNALRIKLGITNKEVVEWIKSKCGGSIYTTNDPRYKTKYSWEISGIDAKEFLEQILPFAIVKKAQISLALDYYNLPWGNKEVREKFKKQLKELK